MIQKIDRCAFLGRSDGFDRPARLLSAAVTDPRERRRPRFSDAAAAPILRT